MSKVRPDIRDAIIEAGFIVFSKDPGAGLGDVADKAGVGRATLHRHFAGRAQLMRALAQTALKELDDAVARATSAASDHEDAFRLSMYAVVPLSDRQWFLQHEAFDTDADVMAAYQASRSQFYKDIEDAKTAGLFAEDVPTVWIAEAFENLIYAAWSLVRSGEATPKQAADLAWRTFSTGLKGKRS